ncbi:MAG: hypothetical protein D8M58_11980 [Calditrichaeota bacterium]|nr:MAG: hypothetical protein DWQ03_12765 [Calditrichota bacterium]MBL1206114.1 hypothetical protein [Calditrichota bacterium]NOG45939.1 hypothetical protein [Calditrichota bacterium]
MARILVLLLAVSFMSCSESSDGFVDPNIKTGLGSFVVEIDDNDWSATTGFVNASISKNDSVSTALVTSVKNLTVSDTEGFGVSFSNILSGNPSLEDTYQLDGTTVATIVFIRSISDNDVTYNAISGELKITEVSSSNVKGTFNAVLQNQEDENDTLNMTGGAFNAAITTR